MYGRRRFAAALILCGLGGCGLTVPEIGEIWDRDYPKNDARNTPVLTATAQIEYEIKQKIYCELRYAVQEAEKVRVGSGELLIPESWGTQMQLSLTVDESIALNPGISFTQVLPNIMKIFGVLPSVSATTLKEQLGAFNAVTAAQSFSLGLGGTLSSEAMRIDKFNTYYSINDLRHRPTTICQIDGKPDPHKDPMVEAGAPFGLKPASSSPLIIESDLGIKDWLIGAILFNFALPSSPQPRMAGVGQPSPRGGSSSDGSSFRQDSFSHEIKFIIVSSGNIQPTWKLIRFSANTGTTPFFSTGRTRTHDLIITVGPPTQRTTNDFLASQIGEAVRAGYPNSP